MKEYKRQYHQLSDETKAKISNSNKNKPKTEIQKQRIRQAMIQYWKPCLINPIVFQWMIT